MKALIFNSGLGNRMGDFTRENHKSMAVLSNGETLFARQLRLIAAAGIEEVVVTTGPHVEQLRQVAAEPRFAGLEVTFVANEIYDRTNYIYSMYLAREHLRDDVLLMHGDLVFNRGFLEAILADDQPNLGAVNAELPLPEKDFKARIKDGLVSEVSVSIHDADCIAFQPLYKLSRPAMTAWLERVGEFVDAGETGVYAENALNEISDEVGVRPFSYAGHYVNEVDTLDDLREVSAAIRLLDFEEQPVLGDEGDFARIPELLRTERAKRPLVVGGRSFSGSLIETTLDEQGVDYVRFSGYSPNPKLQEVLAGLAAYSNEGCDAIVAVGGGSAIDVAKCIKLLAAAGVTEFEGFPGFGDPLLRRVPQITVPTTAGTGSESTHFAVVYIDGEKHSIAHDALMPDYVILEPELLRSLPEYHKKASLLDALAQSVESIWAKGATEQSRGYARQSLRLLLDNFFPYFRNDGEFDPEVTRRIQLAANFSGRAINLTKTTAAHAMSYGLTAAHGIAHGHAAALSLRAVWRYYIWLAGQESPETEHLREALMELTGIFEAKSPRRAVAKLDTIFATLRLDTTMDIEALVEGVNAERLGNSPVPMTPEDLRRAYGYALGLRSKPHPLRRRLLKVPGQPRTVYERISPREVPELQAYELKILRAFDEFCTEHELQYYLSEGSMLGAVRHGGMIPWDDDIDVMMPRPDFDRFRALVREGKLPESLNLDCFETNPRHWVFGAKLQMKKPTKFFQPQVAHVSSYPGPHIDIFTVDPVEQTTGLKWRLQKYLLRGLRRGLFMSSGRSRNLRLNLKARAPIYLVVKIAGNRRVQRWISYVQSEFNSQPDSPHWANLCSYYDPDRELFPREWFGKGRRISFDGVSTIVPDRVEDMLERIYGPDYGKIPALSAGHRKHDFYVR